MNTACGPRSGKPPQPAATVCAPDRHAEGPIWALMKPVRAFTVSPRTYAQAEPSHEAMRVPHPIPYQGSKRNLAPAILGYFPGGVATLIEPFAGSAALTLATAHHEVGKPIIESGWKR